MKFFIIIFFFFFSFTFVSTAFDHFILSVQYTPGYCNSTNLPACKPGIQDKFVLQGLLPSDHLTPPFQPFKVSYLSQYLRNDLHHNWEDIYSENVDADESLWRDEWSIHGNFSGMAVFDYFRAANHLFSSSNLNNLQQLLPRNQQYPIGQLRWAIRQTTKFADSQIVCRDQKGTGQLQITEINFNFTPGFISTDIFPMLIGCYRLNDILFP